MTVASSLLRSARRYSGLSGRALAGLAGCSQPGLTDLERGRKDATSDRLDRLLTALGYQLAVLPTRRGTAAAAACDAGEFLERGDRDGATRTVWQLADDLSGADPALRVALTVMPPATTGERSFDALIAAVVDELLSRDVLPRPGWLDEPWRCLDVPWDVEPVVALQEQARAVTPAAMVRHGIYLDADELVNS
jgi:transcriptional regulator with XRE-family HTH domain